MSQSSAYTSMSLCVVVQNAQLIRNHAVLNHAMLRAVKSVRVMLPTNATTVMMDTIALTQIRAQVRCAFHRITLELRYKHLSQLHTTQA